MLGASPIMQMVFERIRQVASTPAPVLIIGESGTGKDLVARALHTRSRRHAGPFIPVHTGAVPKDLVANELFGHERGAFTGAHGASEGKFAAAEGGTLFLDEVGTMDLATQICLLRVLETHRFTRVGANKEEKADVRIVAATNSDLLHLVEQRALSRRPLLSPQRVDHRTPSFERAQGRHRSHRGAISSSSRQSAMGCLRRPFPPKQAKRSSSTTGRATSGSFATRWTRRPFSQRAKRWRPRHRLRSRSHRCLSGKRARQLPAASLARPLCTGERTRREPPSRPQRKLCWTTKSDHPMVVRVPDWHYDGRGRASPHPKTLKAASGNKQRAARILGISRRGLYVRLAAYGGFAATQDESPDVLTASGTIIALHGPFVGHARVSWAYVTHEESDERKREEHEINHGLGCDRCICGRGPGDDRVRGQPGAEREGGFLGGRDSSGSRDGEQQCPSSGASFEARRRAACKRESVDSRTTRTNELNTC